MKTFGNKLLIIGLALILLLSTNTLAFKVSKDNTFSVESSNEDLDPNEDLWVTVSIKKIRALDDFEKIGGPDFYVKIFINDQVDESQVWRNQKYLTGDPNLFEFSADVPDDEENVNIKIQLWDKQLGIDRLCDLSDSLNEVFPNTFDVELVYNLKTGHWRGEDYLYPPEPTYFDESGYGRLSGCDDNSIYENDRDCELWFDITQNDTDGDGIPYWTEENIFETDPTVNDTGLDLDNDGVPIEWEHKWGHYIDYNWHTDEYEYVWYYDPFVYENHSCLDPDEDGLDNVEEYLTSQWGSDPFRKDIFVELDQMEAGPNGEPASVLPEGSKELIKTAFNRQNIVYHIDDGCMGGGGWIPFIEHIPMHSEELNDLYEEHFLNNNTSNWRRGVFHYSMVLWDANFSGYNYRFGAWQISYKWVKDKILPILLKGRDVVFASVYMHEHGHSLGLNDIYGHDRNTYYPWQFNWWKYRPYKSCMNYGYTYFLVDFSDGSNGKNDMDDWQNMDLRLFQRYSFH